MADTLLIRLPQQSGALASWLVADSGGRIVMPLQRGSLLQAAGLAASRRVCVLAPASDVVLTEVDVPPKSGAKIQQIVPYALEEQLAEDIELTHFAVGRRGPDSLRTPVAIVRRALMSEWLESLRHAGITTDVLYPESELVPANPGQAVALLEEDSVIVRPPGALPVTLPSEALAEALELTRPAEGVLTAGERTGSGLVLYTGAAEWQRYARQVEAVRDRFDGIKVQLLTDGPLALYAQQAPRAASHAINLLQGPYAPAHAGASGWRAWRTAAALLVGLIALHALGSTAELLMLKRAEHRLDASIEDTFRQAMPGEHNAIHARERMQQRLLAVREGGSGSGLLAALAALAQARGPSGAVVQALSFHDGALDMKLSAPNADALDRISQSLQASGWQAQLTSGNTVGNAYEGRIQIKPRA